MSRTGSTRIQPDDTRARARQQDALAALGNAALTSDDFDTYIGEALRRLADTLDVVYVAAGELQGDGRSLVLRAGVGWRAGCAGREVIGVENHSPAGFALMAGEPVVINDVDTERRFLIPQLFRDHGVVSGMNVPVAGQ